MKKLMIALTAIAVATVVNAASTQWGSGNLKVAADKDGGWGNAYVGAAGAGVDVTMTVIKINLETYNTIMGIGTETPAWDQAKIYNTYKDSSGLTGVNKNPTSGALINAINILEDPSDAGVEYAVAIATYTDATYGDMYMATAKMTTWNGATSKGSATGVFSTVANWQAVPEPTSGLLLLLGVAGLALRRRRA